MMKMLFTKGDRFFLFRYPLKAELSVTYSNKRLILTMMDNNLLKAKVLLGKYRDGTCTEEEKAWVEDWYLKMNPEETDLSNDELTADLRDLQSRLTDITAGKRAGRNYALIAIAATLLIVSGIGLYLFINGENRPVNIQPIAINDAAPGTNRATLTLNDGSVIPLNGMANGIVAQQSGIKIIKTAEGRIVYTVTDKDNTYQAGGLNTITTPKGGQYQIVLPDGSKVFLNAASVLRYPASFTGKERKVELKGEAYFDVARNKAMPFIVSTTSQDVKVLGTHFNINSYPDEGRTVTTLEEGSVRIRVGRVFKTIRPGEQSVVYPNGNLRVQQADMQTALAWKNNEIAFKDVRVEEIMRQVARWYNLEVEYQGAIPDDTITGSIDRQSKLSTVLKMFDTVQIHFTLVESPAGKKLIIRN